VKKSSANKNAVASAQVDASHLLASTLRIPVVDNARDPSRTPAQKAHAAQVTNESLIHFRPYQRPVFLDRTSGILILHWSRQIGKSFTLASWAVDRLLTQLQSYDFWLITVLSNSRDNGAEFVIKCAEICNKLGMMRDQTKAATVGDAAVVYCDEDQSPDIKFENMRMEVRITIGKRVGRIKVLAANPRTARGFSGDLILDEFAFHEDSNAIWEAAEPILSSNREFLCRIASTGNGKHNMFYRMAGSDGSKDGTLFVNAAGFCCSKVSRSEAYKQGVKVFDPNTRKEITPDQARAKSLDKRAYDQNYELQFADENMALLTHDLISAAERSLITIDSQAWTPASLARMLRAEGDLECGQDFGRNRDLSVVCVIERLGNLRRIIAMLRMEGMRSPAQQVQLDLLCAMPRFKRLEMDMTGNGLGLCEYTQERWGTERVAGVNFGSSEPVNEHLLSEGRKSPTARVTELMAVDMVAVFEDRAIEIPVDQDLRDSLRKPERITSPGGRVSIAATRDEAGHADEFWSIALAIRAGNKSSTQFGAWIVLLPFTFFLGHAAILGCSRSVLSRSRLAAWFHSCAIAVKAVHSPVPLFDDNGESRISFVTRFVCWLASLCLPAIKTHPRPPLKPIKTIVALT
jgi:phage FluMu gp28-like protein